MKFFWNRNPNIYCGQNYSFNVKYRYLPAIPHDRRHHTKTDYKQLLKIA